MRRTRPSLFRNPRSGVRAVDLKRAPQWTFRVYADSGDVHWSRPLVRKRCRFRSGPGNPCGVVTSLVHPYCLGCLPAALHLTIKVSTLRKAGRGLFACDPDANDRRIVFARGEFIAPYLGEPITLAGLKRRYFDAASDPDIEYVRTPYVAGNGRLHFDGAILRGPAVYCNDAKGTRHHNTACIRWNARGAPCLYATTDIANGQEIFTGYGAVYWAAHQLKVETVLA